MAICNRCRITMHCCHNSCTIHLMFPHDTSHISDNCKNGEICKMNVNLPKSQRFSLSFACILTTNTSPLCNTYCNVNVEKLKNTTHCAVIILINLFVFFSFFIWSFFFSNKTNVGYKGEAKERWRQFPPAYRVIMFATIFQVNCI